MTAHTATLECMTTTASNRRELAGAIVRDYAGRAARDIIDIEHAAKISHSAMYDFLGGKPSVSEGTLRRIEGAMKWPMGFLTAVIDGDRITIELFNDRHPDLCEYTLRRLAALESEVRRAKPRRGA